MQHALQHRTWLPATAATTSGGSTSLESLAGEGTNTSNNNVNNWDIDINADSDGAVTKLVSENAVIVFGRRGCCMCHVVQRLLQGLGVNPTVFDVDESDEAVVARELSQLIGVDDEANGLPQFPAVFVGGKLFGGLERVMATHISGELVPILKEAGALWL